MRRYSPQYYSPPRRDYGGRGRSPPRRGYGGGGGGGVGGGGYGRRKEQNHGSLLVRNIPLDCSIHLCGIAPELKAVEPRGFAFVQFVDSYDASEAQYHMNGKTFAGREISVVVAAESRKRPEEMRQRTRPRGPGPRYGDRRSSHYGRSRSRSISRSRSPRYPSGSRSRYRSRSRSPAPKRRDDYSVSPSRRHADQPRSPRGPPRERDDDHSHRSYSPGYDNAAEQNPNNDGKPAYESEDVQGHWSRRSPGRTSISPPGSR
ncbi:hypothetical protein TIFTF001_026305 [Ficus carica]|uniref:RRM domain-containing protein n=1 Tax=Ficus carica TaxID=3494 RepID=A0AA88DLC8_FICCA|nr:hypothetical protein TIFTF001_026305 [Ficus carica]